MTVMKALSVGIESFDVGQAFARQLDRREFAGADLFGGFEEGEHGLHGFNDVECSSYIPYFSPIQLFGEGPREQMPRYARHDKLGSWRPRTHNRELTTDNLLHPSPNSFHRFVTRSFVSGSIVISSGQGRVKPSLGHLRVASTPILEPKSGRREAWSSESTGPSVN